MSAVEYESTFDNWAAVSEDYSVNTVTGIIRPETYWDSDTLRVTYVSGYGVDHKTVPDNIQQGIYRLCANLYDHRADLARFGGQGSLPFDAASFLEQERVVRI